MEGNEASKVMTLDVLNCINLVKKCSWVELRFCFCFRVLNCQ